MTGSQDMPKIPTPKEIEAAFDKAKTVLERGINQDMPVQWKNATGGRAKFIGQRVAEIAQSFDTLKAHFIEVPAHAMEQLDELIRDLESSASNDFSTRFFSKAQLEFCKAVRLHLMGVNINTSPEKQAGTGL